MVPCSHPDEIAEKCEDLQQTKTSLAADEKTLSGEPVMAMPDGKRETARVNGCS